MANDDDTADDRGREARRAARQGRARERLARCEVLPEALRARIAEAAFPADAPREAPWVAEWRATFGALGIIAPPVPSQFANAFREADPWLLKTRAIDPIEDLYMFRIAGGTAESRDLFVPEYMAMCHAGHGGNSYGVTLYLVTERLVLRMQALWGGVYSDPEQSTDEVNAMLLAGLAVIDMVERATDESLRDDPLVVVSSGYRMSFRIQRRSEVPVERQPLADPPRPIPTEGIDGAVAAVLWALFPTRGMWRAADIHGWSPR